MTFVFDEFELDPARRELRVDGKAKQLQPQVFDLLLYLVEHHERLVPKRELLDTLWPDSTVTESSIQRAVSLARSALGERGPELIQTFPRQGYRFVGKLRTDRTSSPGLTLQPRYTLSGDVHIAYATLGGGDADIVVVSGWIMPMRAMFKHPKTRSAIDSLARMGRVIQFDKRGTGLSDRVKDLPSHEQRMDDLRVVLDACGSDKAILVGFSEGGALAMLYAAMYPERVRGLVLCGAFARMTRARGYPFGYAAEDMEKLKGYIRGGWGRGASLRAIAPSELGDPEFVDWVGFAEQEGSSPGGALDLLEMNIRIDLRALLPTIRVPTVVLQADDDQMIDPASGSYLAKHIPNARYLEAPGDDHLFFFRNQDEMLNAVRWLLSQDPPGLEEDRFLSTVLVAQPGEDIDEGTWLAEVQRFRGQNVPGQIRAYFDGPIRAIRCGLALAERAGLCCGVHTGEVVRRGAAVSGAAFAAGEAMARKAPVGQVWASHVLVDLVPGSDLEFEEVGNRLSVEGREITPFAVRVKS
ncbi:MAG: alpha/beta fold hydrolase [Polyangiales bacterium]